MTHLIHWLYTNVWGNLVASGICTIVGWLVAWHKIKRHHAELKAHITQQLANVTENRNV